MVRDRNSDPARAGRQEPIARGTTPEADFEVSCWHYLRVKPISDESPVWQRETSARRGYEDTLSPTPIRPSPSFSEIAAQFREVERESMVSQEAMGETIPLELQLTIIPADAQTHSLDTCPTKRSTLV
jgi:hypothetical protein